MEKWYLNIHFGTTFATTFSLIFTLFFTLFLYCFDFPANTYFSLQIMVVTISCQLKIVQITLIFLCYWLGAPQTPKYDYFLYKKNCISLIRSLFLMLEHDLQFDWDDFDVMYFSAHIHVHRWLGTFFW